MSCMYVCMHVRMHVRMSCTASRYNSCASIHRRAVAEDPRSLNYVATQQDVADHSSVWWSRQ